MKNNNMKKFCSECKKYKSISDFNKNNRNKDGLYSYCIKCSSLKQKQNYRTKNGWVNRVFTDQKKSSSTNKYKRPEYTKDQLRDWCFSQELFNSLFKKWEDSGFEKKLAPSIDRIDDYDGYNLANIQLVTYEFNISKGNFNRKNGINNKMNKSVVQIDSITGKVIKEYYSMNQAGRETGISYKNIFKVCKEKRITAGGFKWKYKNQ